MKVGNLYRLGPGAPFRRGAVVLVIDVLERDRVRLAWTTERGPTNLIVPRRLIRRHAAPVAARRPNTTLAALGDPS